MKKIRHEVSEQIIKLKRFKVLASNFIGGHALYNLEFEQSRNNMLDGVVYKLKTEILGEKLGNRTKVVKFLYPKTWWQMFKEQYFPEWLLLKYPVKYKIESRKVSFTKIAMYPKLPEVYPKCGDIVIREMISEVI